MPVLQCCGAAGYRVALPVYGARAPPDKHGAPSARTLHGIGLDVSPVAHHGVCRRGRAADEGGALVQHFPPLRLEGVTMRGVVALSVGTVVWGTWVSRASVRQLTVWGGGNSLSCAWAFVCACVLRSGSTACLPYYLLLHSFCFFYKSAYALLSNTL
ncbi:hypothetical protein DQ04_02471100 [Trypanosoma grayi]|uniref:hypothetical protein n=1 Tax=Trypanosoma grayi TaxID=71804 RepID=UPI0004F40E8B|nr:hypothetical protein DQ04_02471100 [Trypanosoma grayi]KEG11583.1 hypothetical protein DQ04_02471100 [Trypanosoma grayi]